MKQPLNQEDYLCFMIKCIESDYFFFILWNFCFIRVFNDFFILETVRHFLFRSLYLKM